MIPEREREKKRKIEEQNYAKTIAKGMENPRGQILASDNFLRNYWRLKQPKVNGKTFNL